MVNFTQRLDDPEVYAAAFSEADAYDRIYDEVLADGELRERTSRLLGGVDFAVHDEAVDVLRQVMPPEYLREQVEANIRTFHLLPAPRKGRPGNLRRPARAAGAGRACGGGQGTPVR